MKGRSYRLLYASVLISATAYGISFPLLSISLEQMGVSGKLIGLNAAMPALGWLIGSFFLPRLQAVFGLRMVLLGFLGVVMLALAGFSLVREFWVWTGLRFFFGGGLGMFYRAIEYWLNGISENYVRGRNIGIYATLYMLGIAVGSSVQPLLGTQGFAAYGVIFGLLFGAGVMILTASFERLPDISHSIGGASKAIVLAAPVAFLAIFAYGLIEDIAAYLMSIYAMRNRLGPEVAALTLTAVAIGNLIFPIPVGYLSDRMNRLTLLVICALITAVLSAVIPATLHSSTLFLLTLIVWGGMAGAVYSTALAMIGDQYKGPQLAVANAVFGIVYATGGLIGPLINGAAIDRLDSHGLMVSAVCIFGSFVILSLFVRRFQAGRKYAGD